MENHGKILVCHHYQNGEFMELLMEIFGSSKDLTIFQMAGRGIIVFIIALALLRISGRRSFGLRTPLDNIIGIILGAVLSRAIVGASPFFPVIVTCFIIVLIHRILGKLIAHSEPFSKLIEGEKIILFDEGSFIESNIKRSLLSRDDIYQGIRKSIQTENLDLVQSIYFEANGEITVVKKDI